MKQSPNNGNERRTCMNRITSSSKIRFHFQICKIVEYSSTSITHWLFEMEYHIVKAKIKNFLNDNSNNRAMHNGFSDQMRKELKNKCLNSNKKDTDNKKMYQFF